MSCLDDNDTSALLDGGVLPAAVHEHLASCAACRRLISALADQLPVDRRSTSRDGEPAALVRGARLDRYVIVDQIGAGSTGAVYEADDPHLARRVALKVLRPSADSAPAALVREARAMARLAHPNVVAVHDAGVADDRVYLAMELVSGGTLRAWLATRQRSWREIRDALVAAGRGLAAAHRAGIVHRDFKPENVLVDDDGRVRVTDFGLAHSGAADDARAAVGSPALIGTPAYMSPEQLRGERATAASDQFGLGVVLYEALFGRRPCPDESPHRDRQVPAHIVEAACVALRADPAARHASVDAMLDRLDREPRRWRHAAIASAAVLAGAIAVAIAVGRSATPEPCGGAADKLAGVWDAARHFELHRAFVATGASAAAGSLRHAERTLDRYAADWIAAHTDSCRATRVRGDQSERVMDLRMQCLATRLTELRAVVQRLLIVDADTVRRAPMAVEELVPVATCGDLAVLERVVAPPSDPRLAARIAEQTAALATARSLRASGKPRDALALARDVAARATALGYPPLDAAAALLLGQLESQPAAAQASLTRAIRSADAGRDDELRARAWIATANVLVSIDRNRDADDALANAAPIVGRLADPETRSMLAAGRAQVLREMGRPADARRSAADAVHELEAAGATERVRYAQYLALLGGLDERLGDLDAADRELRRALAIEERVLGPDHPALGEVLSHLAQLANTRDDVPAARVLYERVLVLYQRAFGERNTTTGYIHYELAHTLGVLGDPGAAAHAEQALASARAAHPPDLELEANTLTTLGDNLRREGKSSAAIAAHQRALEIHEQRGDNRNLAPTEYALALDHASAGRPRDAVPHFERAIATWESFLGRDHLHVAIGLASLGETLLDLRRPADARAVLERAAKIEAAAGTPAPYRASTDFALGRALWDTGDRARGRALVEHARTTFATETRHGSDIDDVEGWLATHR